MISTGGLFTALIFDSVIFAVCFALFCCYRRYRSRRVEGAEHKPAFYEAEGSLWSLVSGVFSYSNEDLLQHCKHEGWMYLGFYKTAFKGISVVAVLGLSILLPNYLSGNQDVELSVDQLGIAHVMGQSLLLIAPVVCIPVFSAMFYVITYRYYRLSKHNKTYSVRAK